ncbi:hypothetical protein [Streptomyces huasconensis]|uniref:hypothetical protein n=1 Tax=Streptomyces huasconensis TaxID=1854574 RepID=UPI0033C8CDC3
MILAAVPMADPVASLCRPRALPLSCSPDNPLLSLENIQPAHQQVLLRIASIFLAAPHQGGAFVTYSSTTFLLLVLAMAVLFAAVTAVIAFGLARWEGAAVPAALTRSGIAFATALTLSLAALTFLSQ